MRCNDGLPRYLPIHRACPTTPPVARYAPRLLAAAEPVWLPFSVVAAHNLLCLYFQRARPSWIMWDTPAEGLALSTRLKLKEIVG